MTNLILPKTITQNQVNAFEKYYEITKLNEKNYQNLIHNLY